MYHYIVRWVRSHDNEQRIRQTGVVVEEEDQSMCGQKGPVICGQCLLGTYCTANAKLKQHVVQRKIACSADGASLGSIVLQGRPKTPTTHCISDARASSLPSSVLPGRPDTTSSRQIPAPPSASLVLVHACSLVYSSGHLREHEIQ
jgi:hypothetical protein